MRRIKEILQAYRIELASVIKHEYKAVFTDGGVLLVMVLAIFIYSTLYASAYAPQVLRNIPIGVIDESQTPSSRELIRTFDAGPNAYVAYEPEGMEEAKELFFARKIYGVVYIPEDYERQLLGGSSAAVSLYVDASYFLMYRQVFQELVSGIGQTGAMVQFQRLIAKGARHPAGDGHDAAGHLPVAQSVHSLSGLRIVRHAGDHHRHHPADAPHRHRHDRRHVARIRPLPQADPRQQPPDVHDPHRAGQGAGLPLDLRRHAVLHPDGALQAVPLSLERDDGRPSSGCSSRICWPAS